MTDLSAFPLPFLASRTKSFGKLRTLRELQMMRCSAHIRQKPEWFAKMNDADIVAMWKREAISQGLTEAQIHYVLAELAHYAGLRDGRTGIEVSAVDGVWQSDTLVDDALGSRLREAVRALEEVPEAERDWLQHRVGAFRLADPTRPGHRKILAFFLVDPSVTIVSTADVPPQQPWSATSTMTLEQARGHREKLMQERRFFVDEHNEQLYEREFSLCEH